MPYINRPRHKESIPYKKDTDNMKYYHSKGWKELRTNYIMLHPLCELCALEGRSTPAEEVHHVREFLSGTTDEERWDLLLNPNNLQSLCSYHHHIVHNNKRRENRLAGSGVSYVGRIASQH